MKTTHLTYSMLVTLLLAMVVNAQQNAPKSDPPDLVVIDKTWRQEFFRPYLNTNPLQPNEDLMRQTRAEKAVIRQRDYSLPNQTTEIPMPRQPDRPISPTNLGRNIYLYKVTVKNTGARLIKAVDWEFQFLHPETNELLGSRRVTSRVKLKPGKIQKLKVYLPQPPTKIVSVDQLDKKYQDQVKQQVVIHRIDYNDGSVWQREP